MVRVACLPARDALAPVYKPSRGGVEIPLWLRCDSDEELLRRIRACLACSQEWTSLEGEAREGRAWQPLPTVGRNTSSPGAVAPAGVHDCVSL